MRLVIQRVAGADVAVGGRIVGQCPGAGLMVLVGVAEGDTVDDVKWLAAKTASLRIFDDADGNMNLSVGDIGGDILAISQFTLTASTRRGNRPSFIRAARPEAALPLYEAYCAELERLTGRPVGRGEFGAHMSVRLTNDGPVTIIIDSKLRE